MDFNNVIRTVKARRLRMCCGGDSEFDWRGAAAESFRFVHRRSHYARIFPHHQIAHLHDSRNIGVCRNLKVVFLSAADM